MSEPLFMSKEGRQKLEAELKILKYKDRPTIVAEIKRTREMGDLSENAEYHAAKDRQKVIEGKIVEIQQKLLRIQLIDPDTIPSDKVYLYAKVLIKDLEDDEEIEYKIAPQEEVDLDNDIISVKSPIGTALLGKGVGETVEVKVPAGTVKYEVLKITRD